MADSEVTQSGLTTRQRLFVEAYVGKARGNSAEAARQAGYAKPYEQGYENLRKPQIKSAIDEFLNAHTLSAAQVLAALTEQATASLEDFITVYPGGMWGFDLEKAKDAGKLHLLKELQYEKGKGAKIGLHDAQAALVQLGRYHKLFTERTEHSGAITVGTMSLDNCDENELKRRLAKAASAMLSEESMPVR